MPGSTLRIATRNSPLALWQAQHVANKLQQAWPKLTITLIPMITSGDRFLKDKLKSNGGKGLFVKELEEALLQDQADIAVHSMKDVPATYPNGLSIMAITARDNPYDALVSTNHTSIHDLPPSALIGTSSLRRQSQLLAIRPDLRIVPLRGNINTRLQKLQSTPFNAIILAAAGLIRMNFQAHISQIIPGEIMLPACGQGAIGIECRLNDEHTQALISPIHDPLTNTAVTTERLLNSMLGGNCHVPVAVYCQIIEETRLLLRAKVLSADGHTVLSTTGSGPINNAPDIVAYCANELFNQGAQQLLATH